MWLYTKGLSGTAFEIPLGFRLDDLTVATLIDSEIDRKWLNIHCPRLEQTFCIFRNAYTDVKCRWSMDNDSDSKSSKLWCPVMNF